MAAPRTTATQQEQPMDGNGESVGGGSVRPVYRSTFAPAIQGLQNGVKNDPGTWGGAPAASPLSMPADEHPAQASLGPRSEST